MNNSNLRFVATIFAVLLCGCDYSKTGNSCEGVDTSQSGPFDISNISININHYSNGISINQPNGLDIVNKNIEIVISTEQIWLSSNSNLWNIIIPTANACSLDRPRGESNVTHFEVVLLGPMSEEEDVSNYFNVVEESEFYVPGLPVTVSEYVSLDPLVSRSYILRANENISVEGEYSISVSISTSSGYELFSSEGPFNIINNS